MRADPVWPSSSIRESAGISRPWACPCSTGASSRRPTPRASTPAIVISRTVARHFGTGSPVGQSSTGTWARGRRPDARGRRRRGRAQHARPIDEPYPEVFVDYRQFLALQQRWGESALRQNERAIGFLSFAIRTRGDPASAVPAVGQIVRSVDPNVGIDAMLPMDRLVASSVARPRFYAVMLGVFAGVAGLLAAIGIYGVLAYAVMQRTQEIGIRMALGAQRAQVLALVLRKGLILTTIGVALGLAGAAAGTRFLQGMLFGITPLDPTTFVAVSLMFGARGDARVVRAGAPRDESRSDGRVAKRVATPECLRRPAALLALAQFIEFQVNLEDERVGSRDFVDQCSKLLHEPLEPVDVVDVCRRRRPGCFALVEQPYHFVPDGVELQAVRVENRRGGVNRLTQQAEKQVLGADACSNRSASSAAYCSARLTS